MLTAICLGVFLFYANSVIPLVMFSPVLVGRKVILELVTPVNYIGLHCMYFLDYFLDSKLGSSLFSYPC